MCVKVNNPGQDYEIFIYLNDTWTRIIKQNATLQFKSSLYDYVNNSIGYDNQLYDSIPYDNAPVEEIRYVIRAINEEICDIFPLYRNAGMILMFNYILSENNSIPDWLTKTSLIDVEQSVRQLSESPRYLIDNTDVISGYIEDSKPYHVVIKDFSFIYSLSDEVYIGSTDFDIPSQYLNEKYVTPQLIYTNQMDGNDAQFYPDDAIWTNSEYKNWFAFKGISVTKDTNAIVIRLAADISDNDTIITVDNASGIPEYGTLTIDAETMSYRVTDRDNGVLTVDRGFDAGLKKPHDFMSDIVIPVGSIIVLNSGNGYDSTASASLVSGSIGPAKPATLEIKTLNGKITDIVVLSEGYGYHDNPTVTISGGDGTAKAIVRPSNGKTRATVEEMRLDRVSYSNTAKTWESAQFYNAKRKTTSATSAASTFALYDSFTYTSVGSTGASGTGATFDVIVPLYAYPTNMANGTIVTSTSSNIVIGSGTDFNALKVGHALWSHDGFKIGIIESIESATQLTLVNDAMIYLNSQHFMYAFGEMLVQVNATGSGYAVGDTVVIYGNDIGGATANNITITVTSIGIHGEIFDFTYTGVSPIDMSLIYRNPV
ncbi:hypothetical protein GHT06_001882 [Daphnia sinensis]|uniref:Uncharacterized protein n=1 Tax=Daphnia sinensis TaxID=1820382 RepID=A0AAD5PKN4_9CRUS|nr:hypothetical protein GHT06_001882 [Daphnia sinensis]